MTATRPEVRPAGARPGGVLRDTVTLTGRVLLHWRQRPGSILLGLLFPVLMVLMFGYLFGGAMAVPDGAYLDFLIPGMLAMTMLFGLESVVLSVTADAAKGVTERVRSMPISPVAVLGARAVADLCSAVVGLAILMGAGLLTGWAPERGLVPTLAAVSLLLWLRFGLAWVGIHLGLLLRTPESAVAVQVLIWPIGFLSSIFVAPSTMPGWLAVAAAWNPLSATATAIRDLFGNPTWGASDWATEHALLLAVVWPAVLTLVAIPLAARQWRGLSR